MKIVDAVRRAIDEDAQDLWFMYVRRGLAHQLHLTRAAPDGFDSEIMRRLARGEQSTRAGMTHVERKDGTLQPWLLLREERRVNGGARIGGRRITDPQMEAA